MGARLGQHFLFDPRILERIAAAAIPEPVPLALEIGPGKGTLTALLAGRAARVVAIETDRRLAATLAVRPPAPNVEVVHGDALRADWPAADVICGNIPYQITSPLIEKALGPPRAARIVFLVQREVAERLAATPGSRAYGALSAGVQLVAEVERLFAVKAGAFRPPPKVDSALVRIVPFTGDRRPGAGEEKTARDLIRALFQRRRQQLARSVREAAGLDTERALAALATAGIRGDQRPEQLSAPQFLALARTIAVA